MVREFNIKDVRIEKSTRGKGIDQYNLIKSKVYITPTINNKTNLIIKESIINKLSNNWIDWIYKTIFDNNEFIIGHSTFNINQYRYSLKNVIVCLSDLEFNNENDKRFSVALVFSIDEAIENAIENLSLNDIIVR